MRIVSARSAPRIALMLVDRRSASTSRHSSTTATAEATGQSLLAKNSVQSVWPIISVCEPPSRSGMTNSPTIGMKQSSAPATTPGARQRQRHQPERLPARAAEIGRGFEQRFVELFQRRVERQHHERQIGIDDADIDRGVGREPATGGSITMPSASSTSLSRPVALQDVDPGIDADQERGPERQHDEQDQHAPARAAARAPCRRRADSRSASRMQRRERGDLQALEIGRRCRADRSRAARNCRATARRRNRAMPCQPAARSSTGI